MHPPSFTCLLHQVATSHNVLTTAVQEMHSFDYTAAWQQHGRHLHRSALFIWTRRLLADTELSTQEMLMDARDLQQQTVATYIMPETEFQTMLKSASVCLAWHKQLQQLEWFDNVCMSCGECCCICISSS